MTTESQNSGRRSTTRSAQPHFTELRALQAAVQCEALCFALCKWRSGTCGTCATRGTMVPEICFRSFAQNLATPSARSFAHRIPHEMIEHLSCAKLSGIFLLKIKCPTRHTRPTHKQKAKREAHRTHQPTTTPNNKKGNKT